MQNDIEVARKLVSHARQRVHGHERRAPTEFRMGCGGLLNLGVPDTSLRCAAQ